MPLSAEKGERVEEKGTSSRKAATKETEEVEKEDDGNACKGEEQGVPSPK